MNSPLIAILLVLALIVIVWLISRARTNQSSTTGATPAQTPAPSSATRAPTSAPAAAPVGASAGTPADSQAVKEMAALTGAVMALDVRSTEIFDRMTDQVQAENHRAAISSAGEGIALMEQFLSENAAALSRIPESKERYTGDLVTYLGVRAAERLAYALQGGSNRRELLAGAEADARRALSFPADCTRIYRDPDMRSNLQMILREARNA